MIIKQFLSWKITLRLLTPFLLPSFTRARKRKINRTDELKKNLIFNSYSFRLPKLFFPFSERPKIRIKSPQLLSVIVGTILYLGCNATGYPPPRVIWFRDKEVLQNRSIEESTSLVLRNVTKDDEGKYICRATNLLGSDSYEVQVNFTGEF